MMRSLRVLTMVLAGSLFFAPWAVTSALAHALLIRSDPVSDVVLASSPSLVHLWFSEDVNPSASKIIVWDRNRHQEQSGSATLVPGTSRQLEVRLHRLAPGAHLVLWTSVSAQDGHVLRGSYIFYVIRHGPGPSLAGVSLGGPTQTFPDGPTLTSLLAHWFELLGATVWVGTAFFSAIVFSPFRRVLAQNSDHEIHRSRGLIAAALVALVLSSAIVLAMQVYQVGGSSWSTLADGGTWTSELGAQYGRLWIVRQALALLTLAMVAVAGTRHWQRVVSAVTASGLLYLALFAASGHAASVAIGTVASSTLVSASVGADWLHFAADSLWLGGQIAIAAVLIPTVRADLSGRQMSPFLDVLKRFGLAAYVSIALYTTSGIFAAKVHIPSWYAFFNSIYGRALIVKMGLIGVMVLTSVWTVYRLRPRLRRDLALGGIDVSLRTKRLLRWLRVNPAVGAGVLLATSIMFYYPVPEGFGPPIPALYVMHSGELTATVQVKPDASGPNTIFLHLINSHGLPVAQAGVVVIATELDMPMGSASFPLHPAGNGNFQGDAELGMGGHWRLTFLMYRPGPVYQRASIAIQVAT